MKKHKTKDCNSKQLNYIPIQRPKSLGDYCNNDALVFWNVVKQLLKGK